MKGSNIMKRQPIVLRNFKCPCCAEIVSAPKKKSRQTSEGHIKDMWCWKCKSEQKFIQIRYD